MKERIIDELNKTASLTIMEINDRLGLTTIEEYKRLDAVLNELTSSGILYYSEKKKKYLLLENSHLVKGVLILNDKGFGFIEIGKDAKDVYVNEKNINGAQDGDTVLFEYLNKEYSSTILMVTHDAFTASYASRVIFIKDGKIFNELKKGDESRVEFFDKIIDVVTLLGGDLNDAL